MDGNTIVFQKLKMEVEFIPKHIQNLVLGNAKELSRANPRKSPNI